jgi:hypothetical protein
VNAPALGSVCVMGPCAYPATCSTPSSPSPDGLGTLERLAEVVTWSQLGLYSKPVILSRSTEIRFLGREEPEACYRATPADAPLRPPTPRTGRCPCAGPPSSASLPACPGRGEPGHQRLVEQLDLGRAARLVATPVHPRAARTI